MSTVSIPLTQGKFALVDASDAIVANAYAWHLADRGKNQYAACSALRRSGGGVLYLHRLLMQPGDGQHVDHINGDGLDCRRANMRLCTNAENRRNTKKHRGASQYKGVAANKTNSRRRWEAYVWFENKKIGLGSYETEVEAARAYNAAAIEYHQEFAKLNVIEGLTDEESRTPPVRNRKLGRPGRR